MAQVTLAEIHPELRNIARVLPRQPIRPLTLRLFRSATGLLERRTPRGVSVLTTADGVGVRLFRPPNQTAPAPAVLWIHGGGYLIGSPAQDDALCRQLSDRLGAVVAAVDYRLAPEHPYPAPLEDCYAALTWLAALPGVDPTRLVVAGASAGGGLAAALALLARDRDAPKLAAQVLVYPMLDDRTSYDGNEDKRTFRLWGRRSNEFGWRSYLGDTDPNLAVPARRTDLAGLPPAWIGVGTHDLFHDEDLAYADALSAAGVPTEVLVVPGAFHGFDQLAPKTKVSRDWFDGQISWLTRTLGSATD